MFLLTQYRYLSAPVLSYSRIFYQGTGLCSRENWTCFHKRELGLTLFKPQLSHVFPLQFFSAACRIISHLHPTAAYDFFIGLLWVLAGFHTLLSMHYTLHILCIYQLLLVSSLFVYLLPLLAYTSFIVFILCNIFCRRSIYIFPL